MTISPTGATPIYSLPYLNETDPPDIATATQQMMLAVEALVNARIGTFGACGMSTVPVGAVLCDGSSLSTTGTYANLFSKIQYNYGGTGGNFNLPDLRGRVLLGTGTATGGVNARTLGNHGGAETHTLILAELPASPPSGTWSASTTTIDNGHSHPAPTGWSYVIGEQWLQGNYLPNGAGAVSPAPANGVTFTGSTATGNASLTSTTTITKGNLGSGTPTTDNIMQPYVVATPFIWYA